MKILLATHNWHKFREFKELFKEFPFIELLSLYGLPGYVAPEETGETFKANALLKAEHAAKHLNCLVLADDSGLVVPALKGEPGVRSRRYAGENVTDLENNKKLLQALEPLSDWERAAYYECCLALASPEKVEKCVEARCEGTIASAPRGRNGFGYDPLFIKIDYDKTFAELDESVKNRVSHRYKAFERLRPFLLSLEGWKES